MLPITRPIDHELDRIHVHRLRHFGLEPFPSHVQDENQSTITGEGFNAVKKYAWRARGPLYLLRWRNFWGRLWFLLTQGRLLPRSHPL
jgi:glycosyl transferase family 25